MQQALRLWTHLTGLRINQSTRDGKCGQKRLDTPLKQWKVIQKKLKFHFFHHWIDTEGMTQIESWKNSKTLSSQEEYENLMKL